MRSLGLVWFAIVAVAAAVVGALPTANSGLSFNPDPSKIKLKPIPRSSRSTKARMTNAKRFSMNLPPLKPKLGRGTRVASARQSNTSPRPRTTQTCNILVRNANNGNSLGYIRPGWTSFGAYGFLQPTQAGALEVSFSYPQDDTSPSQLNFMALNGPSSLYPLFGGTKGFGFDDLNLGPGSPGYAYVTGTTQIPAGSTGETGDNNSFSASTGISEPAESAIWIYNPVTQDITVQWINADGSTPPNVLVLSDDIVPTLFVTGDFAAVQDNFPDNAFSVVVSSDPAKVASNISLTKNTDLKTFTCIPSENLPV